MNILFNFFKKPASFVALAGFKGTAALFVFLSPAQQQKCGVSLDKDQHYGM